MNNDRVDADDWASLMNQNFDARRRIYGDEALGSVNIDMVETARAAGAGAKLSGSGGAVLVCCTGGEQQVVKLIGARAPPARSAARLRMAALADHWHLPLAKVHVARVVHVSMRAPAGMCARGCFRVCAHAEACEEKRYTLEKLKIQDRLLDET